jgi:ERCC4-type nuclease
MTTTASNPNRATRRPIPAALEPCDVVAICDTREQTPLDLTPLQTVRGTLATGDYSVRGLEQLVSVERKSLPDLLGCIGQNRARFDREVQRLLAYQVRALVVEADFCELEIGNWESRVTPAAAVGSCMGWIAAGLPIIFAGDHQRAGHFVSRLLFIAARRRWREARALVEGVLSANQAHAIAAGAAPKAEAP